MLFVKTKSFLCLIVILALMLPVLSMSQDLFINEIMSLNNNTISDEDEDFSDWIEIYNGGPSTINLEGYFISDDPDLLVKWSFPNATVEADSFLLIFASSKDRNTWPGELHTNFKLSSNGESLILSDPDTLEIDQIVFPQLTVDISLGRVGNGNDEWGLFDLPTPGSDNNTTPLPLLQASQPIPSLQAGVYPTGTTVGFTSTEGRIFYTTDGSIPDIDANEYESILTIDDFTVIRAICLVPDKRPSEIFNATYIVNFESELAIVSLITDPPNLWDWETGIYVLGPNAGDIPPFYGANFHQDWERPAYLEFFDEYGNLDFSQQLGMRIHGGYSRAYRQKSLRFYARNEYGTPVIDEQILPDKPIFEYKRFILRNSGTDWHKTLFRDALISDLLRTTNIRSQAYRPAVLFINGEYWGIQNIRERVDKYYLQSNFGADPESIDLLVAGILPEEGSEMFHRAMITYAVNNDINEESVFDSLSKMMDIDNYLNYYATEIFIGNTDWPINNNKCWRSLNPDSKFEWILFDTDFGLGGYHGYQYDLLADMRSESDDGPIHPHFTRLFRRLLDHYEFHDNYIVRSCDLANIIFEEERVFASIERFKSRIEPEIQRHIERWYPENDWEESIEVIRNYIRHRKSYFLEHLRENFELGNDYELIVNNLEPTLGRIRVNAFWLERDSYSGTYFEGLPIQLIAEPFSGYRFAGWSGDIESLNDTLSFVFGGETSVQLNFEPIPDDFPIVVINEINYNSCESFNPGDWIELYAFNQDVNLTGWTLSDGDDANEYNFPIGSFVSQGSFLIVARDPEQFSDAFASLPTPIGGLDFGLSSNGDQIILKDQDNNIIDVVEYQNTNPWPSQPNGNGPTLELIDTSLPNQYSHNWAASFVNYGTPSMSTSDVPDPEQSHIPDEFEITKVYPNPFNSLIQIKISLPQNSILTLSVYNLLGQHIEDIHRGQLMSGIYNFSFKADDLTSGVYFVQAFVPSKLNQTEKIVLLK
jgi:CotH kinase protein/Lamin Tail Domain/Fn3 associated/Secretion system C-terminal sorting domain/Divergent InlB B-repeat domain